MFFGSFVFRLFEFLFFSCKSIVLALLLLERPQQLKKSAKIKPTWSQYVKIDNSVTQKIKTNAKNSSTVKPKYFFRESGVKRKCSGEEGFLEWWKKESFGLDYELFKSATNDSNTEPKYHHRATTSIDQEKHRNKRSKLTPCNFHFQFFFGLLRLFLLS